MQRLYVCSRAMLNAENLLQRHLLGVLSRDETEYQFRYLLDEKSTYLILPIFPDKDKVYRGEDVRQLLDDFLPSEKNTAYINEILNKIGMSEYDEWTWLKIFEPIDETETRLYENLPDNVIIHCDKAELFSVNDKQLNDKPIIDSLLDYQSDADNFAHDANSIDDKEISDILSELDDEEIETIKLKLSEPKPSELKPPSKCFGEKRKTPKVKIVTRTIKKRVKKTNNFIEPPLNNQFDTFQKRLEQNKQLRKQKLNNS